MPGKRGNPNWKPGVSGNPSGKRGDSNGRDDGWKNLLTGLGISGKDARGASHFATCTVDDIHARELWRGNDVAARIIETIPSEMLRAGWDCVVGSGGKTGQRRAENLSAICEDLCVGEIFEKALQYENAYGGAAILPVVNDQTANWETPFDIERVMSVDGLILCEPHELTPAEWQDDLLKPDYGEPSVWYFNPSTPGSASTGQLKIHTSRLIIFPGIKVSRVMTGRARHGWGDSLLTRVYAVLRDYGVTWESVGAILQSFAQTVYKMKGLKEVLAQNDSTRFRKRIEAMELSRSVLRGMVIDAEDDFERQTVSLTGVPDTLDKFSHRLAAAADMPVALLMGMSPGGLNATGDADIRFFYDKVRRRQITKLQPRLERLMKMLFRAQTVGYDRAPGLATKEPKVWSVQFRPLWEPTLKETVETRYIQAQSDKIYAVDIGALSTEEVRASRFGGDQWSAETTLDQAAFDEMQQEEELARKEQAEIMKAKAEAAASGAEPAGENAPAGNDPATEQTPDAAAEATSQKEDSAIVPVVEAHKENRVDYIEKRGSKWVVLSMGGDVLGEFDTEAQALKRLQEIEYFKHKADDGFDPDQPRDENGRWSEGGGESGGNGGGESGGNGGGGGGEGSNSSGSHPSHVMRPEVDAKGRLKEPTGEELHQRYGKEVEQLNAYAQRGEARRALWLRDMIATGEHKEAVAKAVNRFLGQTRVVPGALNIIAATGNRPRVPTYLKKGR